MCGSSEESYGSSATCGTSEPRNFHTNLLKLVRKFCRTGVKLTNHEFTSKYVWKSNLWNTSLPWCILRYFHPSPATRTHHKSRLGLNPRYELWTTIMNLKTTKLVLVQTQTWRYASGSVHQRIHKVPAPTNMHNQVDRVEFTNKNYNTKWRHKDLFHRSSTTPTSVPTSPLRKPQAVTRSR